MSESPNEKIKSQRFSSFDYGWFDIERLQISLPYTTIQLYVHIHIGINSHDAIANAQPYALAFAR